MNKEIIVIFSSKKEAKYFLFHAGLNFKKENDFYLSSRGNIKVYFSGIGKNAALVFNKNHSFQEKENFIVIKAGTAALIDKSLSLLKPYIPLEISYNCKNYILKVDAIPLPIRSRAMKHFIQKVLVTVERPLDNINQIPSYKNFCFADMETFFIYENYCKLPFLPLIVPTDYCDINEFHNNLDKASFVLKDTLLEILKELI